MKAQLLIFSAPRQVVVHEQLLPKLEDDQVLVQSIFSAISPGTELLIYRGKFPKGLTNRVDHHSSNFKYPFTYGYACVGRILELGQQVAKIWQDRLVFAFQPHGSHFITSIDNLHPLPKDCSPESACFLANMETSVNLVQDSAPNLGECAMVFGQGIVGLLTTALLSEFPLRTLITADCYSLRRKASLRLGATASHDPLDRDFRQRAGEQLPNGADLTLELSGTPDALNDAIELTGFGGRIVVGSWYGERKTLIDLGGKFHHARMRIISSQVSTISASLSDRWDKTRRFDTAWSALKRIQPERWITHRFKLQHASEAYQMLDQNPQDYIQILFEYS
jgi:2-desacetyl-2-hydroxyethyl bacteriochlorophyllide A dehydrogenase